ncbi:hypothetical protein FLONG3_565 [Fusarium longipes]|uniref:Uncharacterized protein n=1 Tax=Fusarium longipes TaxID=694270 RepID=A0A395T9L6_9HYPO|nr:hypothetical protein FLONG3_565 [Fusarium longipes]
MLSAEQSSFSLDKDLLGCYDCLRLRKGSCFADKQRTGRRGRQGSRPEQRFCIDCGTRPRLDTQSRYARADHIYLGGDKFILCSCEKRGILPCDSYNENRWVCKTCWEPVARRRRQRKQQKLRREQEKSAKAKDRAERRAHYRDAGCAESDIGSLVSDTAVSDDSDYHSWCSD